MKTYRHLFFDLDHTLWDFDSNSAATLMELYTAFGLQEKLKATFEEFRQCYDEHNNKLWDRFRKGFITRKDLRWKRMWHTLLDFKAPDTQLAEKMSVLYIEILPTKGQLMPYAAELLEHCFQK